MPVDIHSQILQSFLHIILDSTHEIEAIIKNERTPKEVAERLVILALKTIHVFVSEGDLSYNLYVTQKNF